MKNKNTKKQSSEKNSNKSNISTNSKRTLKEKVLKQAIYILKQNPDGIRYGELIQKCINRIAAGKKVEISKNAVHGSIQKSRVNENGLLHSLVIVKNGVWSLKAVLFSLFF
jgi:hypothetical protein